MFEVTVVFVTILLLNCGQLKGTFTMCFIVVSLEFFKVFSKKSPKVLLGLSH